MKIYTKTGDSGTTGLFAGSRVAKDHPRIRACGAVDELNAVLGVVVATLKSDVPADTPGPVGVSNPLSHDSQRRGIASGDSLHGIITEIQSDLFSIGSQLATPNPEKHGMCLVTNTRVTALEQWIDSADGQLSPLKNFILPGGTQSSAMLHLARTVCRRAERDVVSLSREPEMDNCDLPIVYLNRLSDLLFVLARLHNTHSGVTDVAWQAV